MPAADSIPLSAAAQRLDLNKKTLTRAIEAGCQDYDPAPGSRERRIDVREYQAWRDARDQQRRDLRRQAAAIVRAGGAVPPPVAPAPAPVSVPTPAPPAVAPRPVPAAPLPALPPSTPPHVADLDEDVVVASGDDDVSTVTGTAPAPAAGTTPLAAPKPKKPKPPAQAVEAAVDVALPPHLLLARQLQTVLGLARSLSVRRLPEAKGGGMVPGTVALVGITLEELRAAVESGGVAVLLLQRFGPGKYEVSWIGPAGGELYRQVYEVPDLDDEVRALQHRQREADREVARRRGEERLAAAEARRLAAEERIRLADHAEREADQWVWARDVASTSAREAGRRARSAEAYYLRLLRETAQAQARRAAELGTRGLYMATQAHRLETAAEVAKQLVEGGSLRPSRCPVVPQIDPLPSTEQLDPAITAPLLAELDRARQIDVGAVYAAVLEFAWARRNDGLYPLHPLDWRVLSSVEHLLPRPVSPGFMPWYVPELYSAPATA